MKQAVFAFVLKEGQILLTKRNDVPLWVLPGGGIDPGETPENACKREVKEETGLEAKLIRKTHELSPVNRLAEPTHLFLASATGTLLASSDESVENRFFPLDELPKDLFWPHGLWLKEALTQDGVVQRELVEISWLNLLKYALKHPSHVIKFAKTCFQKSR
ncbi:MAG: NUDIX hydrolase [Chlamydiia bacterium]|nr:NUDIX hydrolase [Chlamydiia bacterium]